MRKLFFFYLMLLLVDNVFGQDVRVYHGMRSESVYLKQNQGLESVSRESVKIVRGADGIVTVAVVNPNPLFYTYEIKTEDVDIVDEYSEQFSELVKLINAMPELPLQVKTGADNARLSGTGARVPPATNFDKYSQALALLYSQIKKVDSIISNSDNPESVIEAFQRSSNSQGYGYRSAINSIRRISSQGGNFNSTSLEKDLNDLLELSISGDSSFNSSLGLGEVGSSPVLETLFKQAFKHLNNNLASLAAKVKESIQKDPIIRFLIPVKENKKTTVKLIIKKKAADANVLRETLEEEIAVIMPFYKRKMFQVVPMMNLVFQSNQQKYSIQNGVVKSEQDDEAKFNIGAMAVMNFASFGEFKEFGVGLGVGYSLQPDGKSNSFFAIPSLSYKDVVRFGVGFGYAMSPVGLKNGAKVDAPLPADITNIADVIDYKRRPAVVFTIAIAGIKL